MTEAGSRDIKSAQRNDWPVFNYEFRWDTVMLDIRLGEMWLMAMLCASSSRESNKQHCYNQSGARLLTDIM